MHVRQPLSRLQEELDALLPPRGVLQPPQAVRTNPAAVCGRGFGAGERGRHELEGGAEGSPPRELRHEADALSLRGGVAEGRPGRATTHVYRKLSVQALPSLPLVG